jgi:NAD-dependent dihydropyrimidine dehydrogenase PreA subunit
MPSIIIARSSQEYRAREDALAVACAQAGWPVLMTPHLYHLAEASPIWQDVTALPPSVVIVSALHPRPAEWLLRKHGVAGMVLAEDIRTLDALDDVVERLRQFGHPPCADVTVREVHASVGQRWYPVIDSERCRHCGQCAQFCLFGVYAMIDGRLTVRQPDRCKPGCPACSRLCPHGAIIFPLYQDDPAIAGAPGCVMTPDPQVVARARTRLQAKAPVSTPVTDELDALIDELDALAQRKD